MRPLLACALVASSLVLSSCCLFGSGRNHGKEAKELVLRELSERYGRPFTVENVHAIMYSDHSIEMDVLANAEPDGSGPILRGHAHTKLVDDVRVLDTESFGARLAARTVASELKVVFENARPDGAPPLDVCIFGMRNGVNASDLREQLGDPANNIRLFVYEPRVEGAASETSARLDMLFSLVTQLSDDVRPHSTDWYFTVEPVSDELREVLCTETVEVDSILWNAQEAPHIRYSMHGRFFDRYKEDKAAFVEHARVMR